MHKRITAVVLAAILLSILAVILIYRLGSMLAFADQQSDADLLEIATAGMSNARSLILAGKGKVTVNTWRQKDDGTEFQTERDYDLAFAGEQYRVSANVRVATNSSGGDASNSLSEVSYDFAYDGQTMTRFDPRLKTALVGATNQGSLKDANREYTEWVEFPGSSLLKIDSPFQPDGVRIDNGLRIVGRESLKGDECIVVERTFNVSVPDREAGRAINEYWINPNKGFTISRLRIWVQGGGLKEKVLYREIDNDVRQYGGEIWGPAKSTRCDYKLTKSGEAQLESRIVTAYDPGFQVNTAVTKEELSITLPSGVGVHNKVSGEDYIVP